MNPGNTSKPVNGLGELLVSKFFSEDLVSLLRSAQLS
jgi:hypothetical protein